MPTTLYKDSEFLPLTPAQNARFIEVFPCAHTFMTALRCASHESSARIWQFTNLLVPYGNPDRRWFVEPPVVFRPDEYPAGSLPAAWRTIELNPDSSVVVGLEVPDITLLAPWSFVLEVLSERLQAWVAAAPDLAWFVYSHYSEFYCSAAPSYDRISQFAFVRRFPLRAGTTVEKPQYLIRYDDGGYWLTDDLRDPEKRMAYDQLFAFLSARTGKPIEQMDVLPEKLTMRGERRSK